MEEEKEEKIVEEKKSGKGSKTVIILLILVVLGLACYICYDKGLIFGDKEKTSSANTEEQNNSQKAEEAVTFTDSELEKYVNYINPVSIGPSEKIYNVSSIKASDLSARQKIEYIGSKVYSKYTSSADYQYNIISENDVKNAVEEVYGPNNYEKTTFNLGCGDYTLNESENNYYSRTGCGGATATMVSNVVTNYKATSSKLEITTNYAFFDGSTSKIYKDYNKTNALADYSSNNPDETEKYMKDYVKNNKDKLNSIVYTFESKDGRNYYFTGFVNNK